MDLGGEAAGQAAGMMPLAPADLVHALGGPSEVARQLGLTIPAVCNWYDRGVPPVHYLALWRMAQEAGVDWAPPGAEGFRLVPAA